MQIGRRLEALLLAPLGVLLAGALIVPAGILFYYSLYRFAFLELYGGATVGNYTDALTSATYRVYARNTLWIALPTTAVSVVAGYLLAYYLVFGRSWRRNLVFALVLSALMASYLVRIYAWKTLLGSSGILNSALTSAGVVDEPIGFLLFSRVSVILAEINLFTPFAALAFYAALAGISPDYREVSRDLGAGQLQTLWRVTLPLSGRAILATTAVVFFLASSDYVTPTLVGGPDSQTIGVVISTAFGTTLQYGLGAALSFLTLLAFVLAYVCLRAAMRVTRILPKTVA
ncbi:MAG: ABC transporter permease [Actinobacteria bacterium]|nr:ABC transporter permease [Actinomycetota bacterium]